MGMLRRDRRSGFSLVETLVVILVVGTIFLILHRALKSSTASATRSQRVDMVRLARRIIRRIEEDLHSASIIAAPKYGQAALTLVFYDDRHHRVQYFNRDEGGTDIFTLEDAENAKGLRVVREEDTGDEKVEMVRADPHLKYVLFRRLGKRLVGVDVQLDHEKLKLPTPERARFSVAVSLDRHFD
jgi:prepilin-type N-terminal cleavage/methylation domain-containing protein